MSISVNPLPGTVPDPLYPHSDGEPMGETDFHIAAIILLREGLQFFFRGSAATYVATDMFLYYERDNPRACKAPDVMVVKGVGKHFRLSFRTWEENTHPCAVFEVTSPKTRREDFGDKMDTYARLGVADYFLFDPLGDYLDPPLQGFRLQDGTYQPLPAAEDGSLLSEELGLRLVAEGHMVRLIDAATGQPILTWEERAEQAEQRAEQEQQRAEQQKQRAEQEQQRAEQQKQRAEQEQQRAEQERQRADALAAEVARLRASLPRPENGTE
jgi:Uma2 family endonuclease